MANKKLQEKKKKKRLEIAKQRVLERRTLLNKQRAMQKELAAMEALENELKYGKPKPIVNGEAGEHRQAARNARASEQLLKNLQLLEALEAEYEEEQLRRAEVNENLEAEGHTTVKEKMEALHEKALEQQGVATQLTEARKNYEAIQAEKAEESSEFEEK